MLEDNLQFVGFVPSHSWFLMNYYSPNKEVRIKNILNILLPPETLWLKRTHKKLNMNMKQPTFMTATAAVSVTLSLAALLGAHSIWFEEQPAVPVVWVVE